jgi:hypothetical protein
MDTLPANINDEKWYKIVSAPPGEEVDWLSPITSSYTLCATKSGKVVCWDIGSDTCLAQWNPGSRWELWKCRVEFEERTVFFTMAKVLTPAPDDERVMKFVLMRLTFFEGPDGEEWVEGMSGESLPGEEGKGKPVFGHVAEFWTRGVVMNVFLLDPGVRLLSAFVWVSRSNTIGLYVLLDWEVAEYVFVDTGIECVRALAFIFCFELILWIGGIVELELYPIRRQYRHTLRRERRGLSAFLPAIAFTYVHHEASDERLDTDHCA